MHSHLGGSYQPVTPVNARLSGTGRIADELYLIAHREQSGKPYLSRRALGAGVAGGLLAELLGSDVPAVTLQSGHVLLLRDRAGLPMMRYARPHDPVTEHVLVLIAAEPPRPVREWLLALGQTAAAEVAGRLERSGYLYRTGTKVPWRARRVVPADQDWAYCALLRAHAALDGNKPVTPYTALLAGLMTACGLAFRFAPLATSSDRTVEDATRILPQALRELIAHVQVTADAALQANRK